MTAQKKNYARRVIDCRGPHFRIDSGHPQIGASGAEVFKIYATNDNDENHSTILYTAKGPPELLDPKQPAWTNFEQKYFTVGETCYQITFHKTKKKKVVTK